MFSLQPIKDYRPPMLSGHKDTPVGVFFVGARAASAAVLDGAADPDLLTVSRDGALFTWRFEPVAAAAEPEADGGSDEAAAEDGRPPKRTRAAKGTSYAGALALPSKARSPARCGP